VDRSFGVARHTASVSFVTTQPLGGCEKSTWNNLNKNKIAQMIRMITPIHPQRPTNQ